MLPLTGDCAPGESGIKTLSSIYSHSDVVNSIALKKLHRPVPGKILSCRTAGIIVLWF
jgi:hypothetical protein